MVFSEAARAQLAETDPAPTVGRIVQYRQARGSQAWLPAIVTVTVETFVPGVWATPAADRPGTYAETSDRDGETYRPSEIPPVKAGRVHLRVFSPTAHDYPEFNVAMGDGPGCWRWPPRA